MMYHLRSTPYQMLKGNIFWTGESRKKFKSLFSSWFALLSIERLIIWTRVSDRYELYVY